MFPFVHILESEGTFIAALAGPENMNIYALWKEYLAQPEVVARIKRTLIVKLLPDFQVWLQKKGFKALEYTRYALDY